MFERNLHWTITILGWVWFLGLIMTFSAVIAGWQRIVLVVGWAWLVGSLLLFVGVPLCLSLLWLFGQSWTAGGPESEKKREERFFRSYVP